MKTYNSNAERGERMRHWPLEKWETRPLAAGCRHLLQQDDCSNNWNGIQAVMNAGKVIWMSGKCRISKEQILIITFGSPRRQAGDLQCNAEKGNVGWDISHWREEIETAQLQTQELTSDGLDNVDNSWNRGQVRANAERSLIVQLLDNSARLLLYSHLHFSPAISSGSRTEKWKELVNNRQKEVTRFLIIKCTKNEIWQV